MVEITAYKHFHSVELKPKYLGHYHFCLVS